LGILTVLGLPDYIALEDFLADPLGAWNVQAIRIPDAKWGEVWRTLVATGPISCIGPEPPIYVVSDRQIRTLRRKKLPFEIVPLPDGREADRNHA
jgi:hypothetical protein